MSGENDNQRSRCHWAGNDPKMQAYHDHEWGVPVLDDQVLFEFLVLESAQAGLSWSTVLNKRENYRNAFAGFDPEKVARYGDTDVRALMNNEGIIRNKAKIEAAINNASCFLAVRDEFGSFARYSWQFVNNKPIVHAINDVKEYPVKIKEAEVFAADLKKRGFKFLGPVTIYAHMQAVGMVNDHMNDCYRKEEVMKMFQPPG